MRNPQNRIKKITFYVDALELYPNPDDLESESVENIINVLREFSILDYDIHSISIKKTADHFVKKIK